jgi:hypothetical protein
MRAKQSHPPPQPLETEVAAFGDVAALLNIAQRLDLVPLLDFILPTMRRQGSSSVRRRQALRPPVTAHRLFLMRFQNQAAAWPGRAQQDKAGFAIF